MTLKLSRRSDIESFRALKTVREVNKRVEAGQDIIQLHYGQPCFGAPTAVLKTACEDIMTDQRQGYTGAVGTPELQQRIARYYAESYNVPGVDPERIAITIGSSGAFIFAFLAAFDEGDTVAITTPTYPAYKNILNALDIKVLEIPTTIETNYQPTADLLENCGHRFDGLIINSPSNPTGCLIETTELEKISRWCDDNDVRLISDEAYHRITYEQDAATALPYSKTGIITNTFSKYFAMTGWRLGWMILPNTAMAERVKKLAENLFVSPPTQSQRIACNIFDHLDVLDGHVAHYKRNRDILKKGLPEAGFNKLSPMQGAFYTYVDLSDHTDNSEEFCARMIDEAGVSCAAGLDFDTARGHQTMRISYAGPPEDMHEACIRLKKWLG